MTTDCSVNGLTLHYVILWEIFARRPQTTVHGANSSSTLVVWRLKQERGLKHPWKKTRCIDNYIQLQQYKFATRSKMLLFFKLTYWNRYCCPQKLSKLQLPTHLKRHTENLVSKTCMNNTVNKKAQLSLTNPRDAKACPKLLQFDVLTCTTVSLTILVYLHSFSCWSVRNLRNPAKFSENSNL